jgi:hypothetical protein
VSGWTRSLGDHANGSGWQINARVSKSRCKIVERSLAKTPFTRPTGLTTPARWFRSQTKAEVGARIGRQLVGHISGTQKGPQKSGVLVSDLRIALGATVGATGSEDGVPNVRRPEPVVCLVDVDVDR